MGSRWPGIWALHPSTRSSLDARWFGARSRAVEPGRRAQTRGGRVLGSRRGGQLEGHDVIPRWCCSRSTTAARGHASPLGAGASRFASRRVRAPGARPRTAVCGVARRSAPARHAPESVARRASTSNSSGADGARRHPVRRPPSPSSPPSAFIARRSRCSAPSCCCSRRRSTSTRRSRRSTGTRSVCSPG